MHPGHGLAGVEIQQLVRCLRGAHLETVGNGGEVVDPARLTVEEEQGSIEGTDKRIAFRSRIIIMFASRSRIIIMFFLACDRPPPFSMTLAGILLDGPYLLLLSHSLAHMYTCARTQRYTHAHACVLN